MTRRSAFWSEGASLRVALPTGNDKRADEYDHSHTTSCRRFAAGWIVGGGKITGISTGELKRSGHMPNRDPFKKNQTAAA